jgi:hypothetical protein
VAKQGKCDLLLIGLAYREPPHSLAWGDDDGKTLEDQRQNNFPLSEPRRRRHCERSEAIFAEKEIASSPPAPRNDRALHLLKSVIDPRQHDTCPAVTPTFEVFDNATGNTPVFEKRKVGSGLDLLLSRYGLVRSISQDRRELREKSGLRPDPPN